MSPPSQPQDFSWAARSERGSPSSAQIEKSERAPHVKVHRPNRPLVTAPEPPIGAHIVTRRHGYMHHGIYAGFDTVVHYAGLSGGLRRGPVEEISLSRFAATHRVSVVSGKPTKFGGPEVVRRARSRIGEDNYRLLTNNCEHFCEWCLRGQHRSYQIETLIARCSRAAPVLLKLLYRVLFARANSGIDAQAAQSNLTRYEIRRIPKAVQNSP
jgi:hypothetical protein